MQNFITLPQPLLGEKYVAQKEKKKNNTKYSGHFRSNAQGQRTHSARTKKRGQVKSASGTRFKL